MRRTATLATLFATSFSFVYADTTSRTTEQQEAAITNPTEECSYYNYAPLNDVIGGYPDIWVTADLSASGISEADKQVFASFNASIPNIAPRGTRAGNFTGVSYNYDTDPDCWWTADKCTTPRISGIPDDVTRCEEPNTWGFTLDDGPNCSHNAYYDYLQSIDQKATLFYIGSNVADWPLEGQRGLADGHEICAHTWSHPYMTSMTNEQAFAELYYSKKIIKEMLGVTVRCWRPPYGDVDDRIRYIAQKLDMITIVWEEDTFDYDWSTLGIAAVQKNYENILALQSSGTYNTEGLIVLSHELDNGTMSLSEEFLPKIRQQFTGGVMPVGVCQNNTNPYVETANYTYPNYAQYAAGTHSISLAAPTAVSTAVTLQFSASPTSAVASSTAISSEIPTASSSSATEASDNLPASSSSKASASASSTSHSGAAQGSNAALAWPLTLLAFAMIGGILM